ncbi:cutinase [Parastagonospora nodorum]|uniref:cutinase n=2 Tax=Phaeosphaeria nodorum (strain SN15 / ATCC MYA-4574 / FGSC 10173) TaxID=321614 RepID=A0A7U2HWE5_PHANO|nr:cutinase [Parastagonospora nodorum]QRC93148.1 cutinase [Parastagonospora nodorum SN15]KAH3932536.1 cutinase [Parastagonospora nodorum]KAH4004827.1 cutinase [Parastagonospora nodorum]KAH4031160.1 cutinase [Parastagonospora nodorum]
MKSFTLAVLPTLTMAALTSISQNDVMGGGGCKAMTVLFARGTTELGNMGSVAGPPFVTALGAMMGGDIAVQGIAYPADVPGFLIGGSKAGSALMAKMVGQVRAQCPDTSLVMAGYSQGGQLVHNAADMLSAQDAAFVNSAVIFGDPNNGKPVGKVAASDTMVVCHAGDLICAGQAVILAPHLTYGINGAQAATFAMQNMRAPAAAAGAGAGAAAAAAKGAKKATRAVTFAA